MVGGLYSWARNSFSLGAPLFLLMHMYAVLKTKRSIFVSGGTIQKLPYLRYSCLQSTWNCGFAFRSIAVPEISNFLPRVMCSTP